MTPQMSGIYDAYHIQPVAQMGQNLAVWTLGKWIYFGIKSIDVIPPGPASQVEAVVASGATALAANATIAKRIVTILQLNDNELLHVRYDVLDNIEAVIWEQAGQQLHASRNIHSRVDRQTKDRDPALACTTFFIMGINRDMNLEVRNPMGYAIPAARVQFWGNRMLLAPLDIDAALEGQRDKNTLKEKLGLGDPKVIRDIIGPVTRVQAEARTG